MRFDFYHLQKRPMEKVLPLLAEKIFNSGLRAVVLTPSKEKVDYIDNLLWTYNPDSWLPHACYKDDNQDMQPIWITDVLENPNHAKVLILIDNMTFADGYGFERVLDIFNGDSEEDINNARVRWKQVKNVDNELHYWQQDDNGRWFEKN